MRIIEQRNRFHAKAHWPLTLACCMILYSDTPSRAQTPYLLQRGAPTFTSADPFELGYVNLANGVVHVEIPLAASPQRGDRGFTFKLVYDSNIWHIVNTGSALVWQPDNAYYYGSWPGGGWRIIASSDLQPTYSTQATNCGGSNWYWVYSNFYWAEPNGTQHYFPGQTLQDGGCGQTNTSSFDSYAQDSSGYHIFVTSYHTAKVYARDGTIVADTTQSAYLEKDVNGNYFTKGRDSNNNPIWVDTLGRTMVTQTTDSQNQYKQYYTISNSQGTNTTVYSVTWGWVAANTNFGVPGVTEYFNSFYGIQSVGLPDGTSYGFTYDTGYNGHIGYGLLNNVTLPSGGSLSFTFANFTDSYRNVERWVSTRTSGGGTWTYTPAVISYCSTGGTGCQQKVTVASPAGDNVVHTFTHNNGAWNTQTAYYTGSSGSGTLLDTVTTDYDFSQPCPANSTCTTGAAYVRPIRNTSTYPVPGGSISGKTEYSYDSPQYGNVIETREWKYYTGTPPSTADRTRDFTYITDTNYTQSRNILDRVTDALTKDGSGIKVAETTFTYDDYSLTTPSGSITNYDALNYGSSNHYRGNPTTVNQWVSGTTYLTQKNYYDTTGHLVQIADPLQTITTYSYTDQFATDNGQNPPSHYTPYPNGTYSNAYLTQVNLPVSGAMQFVYYFGSGKQAVSTDQNGNSTYAHFMDSLDRLTGSYWPGGGSNTMSYSSSGHTHYGTVGGATSQVIHTEDGLARITEADFSNDPSGSTYMERGFDSSGRIACLSNPYRGTPSSCTSEPNQQYSYDGLNRTTKVTNADGTTANTYYGAAVTTTVGGITTQLCTVGTYGTGFPMLSMDAASKKRETWTDGIGRVIEVDEPDSSNNLTVSTCYLYDANNNLSEIDQGSETRSYAHDGLSRVTSETSPEEGASGSSSGTTYYSYTIDGVHLCAGAASAVCYRTDARGIITTYLYDAENRLTNKQYSDSTPWVTYYYDTQPSFSSLSNANAKGRRTGVSNGSGQAAWSYNAKGEVLTEQRTIGTVTKTISYTYASDGSPSFIYYPNGNYASYGYNSAGQLNSANWVVGSTTIGYAGVSAFAANGAVATINLDGDQGSYGEAVSYTYDGRFRPSRVQATNLVGGGTQMDMSYAYYANSDVHVVTNNLDNTRTATYAFDNLNRISTASSQATSGTNCWGQSYSYDRYGNMTAINSTQCSSPTMSVTVNFKNQVTNSGFTYDNGGNLLSDGTYNYTWDAENRVTSVNGVNYIYDGDGKRVQKSNGTIYWYDVSGNVLEETDASGNRLSCYIYFNGKRVGRYDPSGAHYAYLSDLIGSSVVVTDSMGHIQNSSDYYPFGGERHVTSTLTDHYKFTGMERDSESGLDHTLYRQFTSTYGRWMSPDPDCFGCTNPQKLNRYAYALNNPVTLTDPLGLFTYNPCYDNPDYPGCGGSGSGGAGGDGGGGGAGHPCVELRLSGFAIQRPENYGCGGGVGGGEI